MGGHCTCILVAVMIFGGCFMCCKAFVVRRRKHEPPSPPDDTRPYVEG